MTHTDGQRCGTINVLGDVLTGRCCPFFQIQASHEEEKDKTDHQCSVNESKKPYKVCCLDRGPVACQEKYFGFTVHRCCINSTALPDASGIGNGSTPEACSHPERDRMHPCCDGFVCNLRTGACQACVGEGKEGDAEVMYDGCCYTAFAKNRMLIDVDASSQETKGVCHRHNGSAEAVKEVRMRNIARTIDIASKNSKKKVVPYF